ncbi:hypothetical protein JXB41_02150 [Candidatus Woesearchaeota archaeon]|nr:hypothetical protein [Candidatus Woesearchaeota archaeon]
MIENKSRIGIVSTIIGLLMIFAAFYVIAADDDIPVPLEEMVEQSNERMNMSQFSAAWHDAEAGNITEIDLWSHTQTKHWQGYYGDITGTITLDDAQNWTLYDWYNAEPKGEIYAVCDTNGATPNWSTVECFDYSANLATWERFYNMTWNDVDGINETFNTTTHQQFSVGTYSINASTCPATWTHMNDVYQTDKFSEVLLQTDDHLLIYVTIIENDDEANNTDIIGFDNVAHDFQMLVGEDGTTVNATTGDINDVTTRYWFYVDLE